MIKRDNKLKNFLKIFIFFPVLFYFGHRSFIAFDEGFYVLQARWILEKNNWLIPLWWDEYVLDRTIGIQFLIAKSQAIFGNNMFSIYLPTTIAAIIMLFITYKLHEEFFGEKYAIVSPLILSTTYVWFDYSHLATQDIIYSSLVSFGVFSLVKVKNPNCKFYIFLFGTWIGLAFMMKTFLVAVPIAALIPYYLTKKYLIKVRLFWIGLIIGFLPYFIWSYLINYHLDQNIILYLIEKFNFLSNTNNFTNPFYYYIWNIPITFLPWSIFAFIGIIINAKGKEKNCLVLCYFPCILVLILSIFSTKTQYYPLQISSILSLNAYVGIKYLFNSDKYKSFIIFITSKLFPILTFTMVFSYVIFFRNLLNFTIKENIFIIMGLILFGTAWSFIRKENNIKKVFINLILGPYLLTTLLLQSGLFTDRSRELRETMENLYSLNIVNNQIIKVDKSGMNNQDAESKIIRIALLTQNLGSGINSIKSLNSSELAWSTMPAKVLKDNDAYQIVFENEILSPWILIKKK